MDNVKIVPRGRTQKYTDIEYKEKLKEITNDNIICKGMYINANTPILHYCQQHNCEFLAKPSKFTKNNPQKGCRQCGSEIIGSKKRKTDEYFKIQLKEIYGDEFIPIDKYITSTTKIKFIHNKQNDVHFFISDPNSLLDGEKCGVCSGKQIWEGYNDIQSLRPDVANVMVDDYDKHNYGVWSSHKSFFKCKYCNNVSQKTISSVSRDGVCCPYCSDGISYPNKFIFNALSQIEETLDFLEREYSPEWCKFKINGEYKYGIYDIYFGKNNKKYIVEMDGGLGHGNKTITSNTSKETQLLIDYNKDVLAYEHDINVLRIDCFYGRDNRYEYILNNILNSRLKNIINVNDIDFDKANIMSLSSYVVDACKFWNNGLKIKNISDILKLHPTTISNYLKIGNQFGLCTYSPEIAKQRSSANKVYCITTNKLFETITLASKYYGISESCISKCCRNITNIGGKYNGQSLIWVYYEDYINMSENEKYNYVKNKTINNNYTAVVCMNNKFVFEMQKTAALWCNSKNGNGILSCCIGKYKTSGKHPKTGEALTWMYLKDYIEKYGERGLIYYQSS